MAELDLSRALAVGGSVAKDVGIYLRRSYGQSTATYIVDGQHLKSEVDLNAHNMVAAHLREAFPESVVWGEESTERKPTSEKYVWITDPLDGTTNFLRGIPIFCVQIALCIDAVPQLAIIHDPLHEETFTAIRGEGAHLNERRLRVTGGTTLSQALVTMTRPASKEGKRRHAELYRTLTLHVRSIRGLMSSGISAAYAAAGRCDAFLSNDAALYDVICGALIASEAGAAVSDFSGRPWVENDGDILIAHPSVQRDLIDALQPFVSPPEPGNPSQTS